VPLKGRSSPFKGWPLPGLICIQDCDGPERVFSAVAERGVVAGLFRRTIIGSARLDAQENERMMDETRIFETEQAAGTGQTGKPTFRRNEVA